MLLADQTKESTCDADYATTFYSIHCPPPLAEGFMQLHTMKKVRLVVASDPNVFFT